MTIPPPEPSPVPFPPLGELLRRLGVRLQRSKGQHYLRDREVCRRIAELTALAEPHAALEVGAGIGNLTVELARTAHAVTAVELEERFGEWHEYLAAAYGPIRFLYGDFLARPWEELTEGVEEGLPWVGVGNLPYQLTSSILFRFLEAPVPFRRLVFMVQREVADRICSEPGERRAGALTYKIALQYEARREFTVPPEAFLPPPKVHSAVIVLDPLPSPAYRSPEERAALHHFVERVFQYRRKTLGNAMAMGKLTTDRAAAEEVLARCGVDPKRRPETLSLKELIHLAHATPGMEPDK